jgi:beta-glucosidase
MNKMNIFLPAVLLMMSTSQALAGNAKIYHKGWIDFNKNGRMDVFEDPKAAIDDRVNDLLSQMTMEEKTCQLTTLYGSGRVLEDPLPTPGWKARAWKDGIGNIDEEHNGVETPLSPYITDIKQHVEALHTIQRWFVEETRLGIPVDFTNEGIHGLCHYKATYFPAQCGQGATWNRDLIRKIADVEGEEADALGYTNIYSPILDLATDPRWGRCVESYGEDSYLVGQLGLQMVRGLQAHDVVSTPKHFAVYSAPVGGRDGATRTDPHITERDMRTLYLEPFRIAFQEGGALGVMSSYNDYNGEPITGSYRFLTEILRHQFGFRGYVVSDSEALEYLFNKHHVAKDYEDAAAMAVNAGLNIRTNFTKPETYLEPLRKAVNDGKISEQTLNSRVADVLRVKFWLGLFDHPYRGDAKVAQATVRDADHQALALDAARQALVLLKNDSNMLPLKKDLKHIAVIGPNANEQTDLISRYGPTYSNVITVYEGIRKLLPNSEVNYVKGCDLFDKHYPESELINFPLSDDEKAEMDKAVEAAKKADVAILVLGGTNQIVGESRSRTDLNLAGRQEQLLEAVYHTGTPVVLVLLDGRACTINFADKYVPAILHGWYPGEFTGQAIAEALFGDYNPGGHLAVTFPKTMGQIPFHFPFKPGSDVPSRRSNYGALYPFGYGLSYTTFEYSGLQIAPEQTSTADSIRVTFQVRNAGKVAGDEVPQLYVNDEVSSVVTYTKVLRGFDRIHLEPGEVKTVTFTLRPHDLALWDKDMKFRVEPGKFNVMVGRSSADIRLKGSFTMD